MNLARTQFISLITKGITMVLGIVQVIIVVKILSPAEYGLVGLVMSIGALIGVSQHLGIVDGAIREIAVRNKKDEVGKVFWVSNVARQVVTLPLSLLLIGFAGFIAVRAYHRPEIIGLLQLYAAVLVLQGLQDVLGATLTGLKRFGELYAVQIITAGLNVAVFGYLTWQFSIVGFFWAVIVTTAAMVLLLGILVWRQLRGYLQLPSWFDVKHYGGDVMRIGAFMYLSRILFVAWQRLPILILGGVLRLEDLGSLNVAQAFGSKLTIVAAALSEVNLAWMSTLFATQQDEFRHVVQRNMQRVLLLMTGLTLVLVFFTPEILRYVIGTEYLPAERLILVTTVAFFLYALTDIGTSSLFVSAAQSRLRASIYGLMGLVTALSIAALYWFKPDSFLATLAVLAGVLVAYITMVWLAKRRFNVQLLTPHLMFFLFGLGGSVLWLLTQPGLWARVILFALLSGYILWESHRQKLLPFDSLRLLRINRRPPPPQPTAPKIICFAGAAFDQPAWTNRQHMMWRVSQRYPVLYIEPRGWIVRSLWQHARRPKQLVRFIRRWFTYEQRSATFFIKAQWNLIPGSREIKLISRFNHWLNRAWVKLTATRLGFSGTQLVVWLYDTEAAEYLASWPGATVLYDCVDDHAAQAGVDRNPQRVREEEEIILRRADLVTVTSQRLLAMKRPFNTNTQLVVTAGNVEAFLSPSPVTPEMAKIPSPIIGTVGALDRYKIDFELIEETARRRPHWNFVFVGAPVLDRYTPALARLKKLPNVHVLGAVLPDKVPGYAQAFDVCIIPYRSNEYNKASFPLKFWEFMALGKPLVVSGLPELKAYQPLIHYAESAEGFVAAIETSLAHGTTDAAKQVALAREHTWEKRVARVLHLLEPLL